MSRRGKGRSHEKTRRFGVTGVPEAHEFTFAPNVFPLDTSGTDFASQQTSERPLCALAYCGVTQGLSDTPSLPVSRLTLVTSEKIHTEAV